MNTFFSDFLARFTHAATIGNAGNGAEVVGLLRRCRGPEDDYGLLLQDLEEQGTPGARRFPEDSAVLFSATTPAKFAVYR